MKHQGCRAARVGQLPAMHPLVKRSAMKYSAENELV